MSDKPALCPDKAVGEALREVARDVLSDARKAIESPEHSDAVAVHEFRREMKRWRALLRLLQPFLGAEFDGLQTTARNLARDVTREVIGGHPDQLLLFSQCHRLFGIAKTAILPRLDLDKDETLAVTRDDVDLAVLGAVAPDQDDISALFECLARELFAE